MSDIIANAQKLLDGATPAPWELINGEIHQIQHTPEQCTSIRCDHRWPVLSESWGESAAVVAENEDLALMAAVPELAQALAEETYEYAVQVKIGAKWLFLGRGTGGHNFARNAFWFVKKENAQDYMVIGKDMSAPARIVRRRVSPVEEIE